ncbi:hypothetical protein Tco_0575306 [Tanacetum coccineum]
MESLYGFRSIHGANCTVGLDIEMTRHYHNHKRRHTIGAAVGGCGGHNRLHGSLICGGCKGLSTAEAPPRGYTAIKLRTTNGAAVVAVPSQDPEVLRGFRGASPAVVVDPPPMAAPRQRQRLVKPALFGWRMIAGGGRSAAEHGGVDGCENTRREMPRRKKMEARRKNKGTVTRIKDEGVFEMLFIALGASRIEKTKHGHTPNVQLECDPQIMEVGHQRMVKEPIAIDLYGKFPFTTMLTETYRVMLPKALFRTREVASEYEA